MSGKVKIGDRVVCRNKPGHVVCSDGNDKTCLVEYDGVPDAQGYVRRTFSPWVSWDDVSQPPATKKE